MIHTFTYTLLLCLAGTLSAADFFKLDPKTFSPIFQSDRQSTQVNKSAPDWEVLRIRGREPIEFMWIEAPDASELNKRIQ